MVRRTRAETEETRVTLLATARQVFGERGYADTSMDDLTAQANLTRGALYHHFGDKRGLLAAVVEQIDAEMDQRLQTISNKAELHRQLVHEAGRTASKARHDSERVSRVVGVAPQVQDWLRCGWRRQREACAAPAIHCAPAA